IWIGLVSTEHQALNEFDFATCAISTEDGRVFLDRSARGHIDGPSVDLGVAARIAAAANRKESGEQSSADQRSAYHRVVSTLEPRLQAFRR
ncbi:MAG: hypothetical protein PVJ49_15750, partial [Acidobacteriota bacterium]